MRPLGVIVLDEFSDEIIEVLLAKNKEVVETFLLDGLHESLDVGIQVRRAISQHFHFRASVRQYVVEGLVVVPVAIARHQTDF